ncbi:Translation initiation factor IF-2 [Babesia sp. Xinjiang]|uniref:Translation initiation factor IF-2 n=1 Tax=Babesia sp. Xinjiang TaxID=462227 RepID=UPI000A25717E|nr:Translation initiation factor IF-2 [Babesia sp. Xinjiang]XP_028871604.1 Translation initiation factor IF-2 [Babesia sp. Xinjiang]ORM41104.1 Translation initiation factor IF-2 [Babesia sp. Xinjiang]ORM41148.1 Translation initiation factor IF-2 [Babesia sp. Xinjiang]
MAARHARELLSKHLSLRSQGAFVNLKAHIRHPKQLKETPNHSDADAHRGLKGIGLCPPKCKLREVTHALSRKAHLPELLKKLRPVSTAVSLKESLHIPVLTKFEISNGLQSGTTLPNELGATETLGGQLEGPGCHDNTSFAKCGPEVNEELEYKLLEYEGFDPQDLSAIRELHKSALSEHQSVNDQGTLRDMSVITPSYISFLMRRIKTFHGEDCSNTELMSRVMSALKNGDIGKENGKSSPQICKSSSRNLISDQSLEDELQELLSSIRARAVDDPVVETSQVNIPSATTSKPSIHLQPSIDDGMLEQTEQFDYSKVEQRDKASNDASSNSLTVPRLTCQVLASYVDTDINQLRSLAEELDCNPDHLSVDEASFILEELSLPYRVTFTESQRSVTISRVKQVLVKRPLVVTIMGHVDHGKTTLLDTLQRSDIVSTEAGRITQKLGAFKLNLDRGTLVFVDTPGHAAFGNMRARGVRCADVVILVVAADDGVMPQTVEAIELIKRDSLPFVVAVNKVDLDSGAHVRGMLEKCGLDLSDVPIVYISAKHGRNIDELTSAIFNLGERLNLQVDVGMPGTAYVFETELHPTLGGCLRAIVRSGVLRESTWLVCGESYGKVKRIYESSGRTIKQAYPSEIVQLSWPHDSLSAGVFVHQHDSRAEAQKMANLAKRRMANIDARSPGSVGSGSKMGTTDITQLKPIPQIGVVIRCGDQGGLEAVTEWIDTFNRIKSLECDTSYLVERGYIPASIPDPRTLLDSWEPIRIVSRSVGPFNRSDSQFVEAGKVVFLGFSTFIPDGIPRPDLVSVHNVIYELFKDIERIFEFYFGPTHVVKPEATMQVTQLGNLNLKGVGKRQAIGTSVISGTVRIGNLCMILREGTTIARELSVYSMQSSRKDAVELAKGDRNNCLVFRDCAVEVRLGDEIISYTKEPLPPLFGVVQNHILD